MKLVNDHGFLQADLGRCESASLGEVGPLPIWGLAWNKVCFGLRCLGPVHRPRACA